MTTLTHGAPTYPSIPTSRVRGALATLAQWIRTFRSARRAALLEKQTRRIVQDLDAHILRDIGLEANGETRLGRAVFDHRSGIYGLW